MNASRLLTAGGRPIALGQKIGEGGEGAVYELAGGAYAAKLYAAAALPERVAKLEALVRLQTPALHAIAAWPLQTVASQGSVAGFIMPRARAVPLSRISIPQSRKAAVPHASWAWLAHVARNLAIAVDTVHAAGVVIGDVNESNFLVAPDTNVTLIDVDSFQVAHGGTVFPCNVGIPMFTPPELQGRPFEGLRRTEDHDRFGLAVLIFTLLFMGRHPWSGTYAGPEVSFDDGASIRTLPFAWSPEASKLGFLPPPGSVRMDWLTDDVASLFSSAFARRGSASQRPSGTAWALALDAFERGLAVCDFSTTHRYLPQRGDCPWCYLEGGEPPLRFFVTMHEHRAVSVVDVAEIERAVLAVALPAAEPDPFDARRLPRPRGYDLPEPLRTQRRTWWAACIATALLATGAYAAFGSAAAMLAVTFAALVLAAARPRLDAVRAYRREERRTAQARYDALAAEWRRCSVPYDLAARKRALLDALAEYRTLPARYAAELRALERGKRGHQLRAHLERYALEDAKIPGLGNKRKAALQAYGVRSAADVGALAGAMVPGLGTASRYALMTWQEHVRSRFRFDPDASLDERLLAELHARERADRARLEALLRAGPRQLTSAIERRKREREDLRVPLEAAAIALLKAKADVRRATLRPFA